MLFRNFYYRLVVASYRIDPVRKDILNKVGIPSLARYSPLCQNSLFENNPTPLRGYNFNLQHRNLSCHNVPLCIQAGSVLNQSSVSDTETEPMVMVKGDKTMKFKLKTTRLDGVLKVGLQISKSKIDKAFFDDRVRVNGERPRKKSQIMNEGDEIDLIKGPNELNPSFLDISRVEMVKIGSFGSEGQDEGDEPDPDDPDDYRIPAVLKRYKSLTVRNYKQAFKGTVDD